MGLVSVSRLYVNVRTDITPNRSVVFFISSSTDLALSADIAVRLLNGPIVRS